MARGPTADSAIRPERDPRPVVALPRPALPGAVIAVMAAVLALILFLVLDGRRRHPAVSAARADTSVGDGFQAPPALALPPDPVRQAPAPLAPAPTMMRPFIGERMGSMPPVRLAPVPTISQPPIAGSAPATPAAFVHADDPALVFDEGPTDGGLQKARPVSGDPATSAAGGPQEDAPARTAVIGNRGTIVAAGTMIPAVLETPIDSTRPGLIRAVVSEDARGFDGRHVLVPRGSRLIGEYQSDIRAGQHRVLVNWTRLIRPDGITIRIGSPAADAMGGAGVPGRVNNYFFERFAGAALQSALAVGVNLASRPGNGSVIVGLPGNAAGTIGQNLIPTNDLQPKISVKQGAVVNVFVAHDLDFSGAPLPRQERTQ